MTDILTELDRWWPVLGILATLVYGWGVYHLSRRFATKYEHDGLAGCVSGLAGRVDDLERRMETVPDGKTMLGIQLLLKEQRGDMKALEARLEGIESGMGGLKNQIDMLIQHHLEGSK